MVRKSFVFSLVMLVIVATLNMEQAQPPVPLPIKTANELLTNPGFETDTDQNKIPDGWTAHNALILKSDRIKCDQPGKTVAHSGACAFMFRGNTDGSVSNLTQTLTNFSLLNDGVTLQFRAFIDRHGGISGLNFGKAQLKLTDGTKMTLKLAVPIGSGYIEVSDSETLERGGSSVSGLKVKFAESQASGKFLLDDVSLTVSTSAATATPTGTLAAETATATGTAPTPTETPTATPTPIPSPAKVTASDGVAMDFMGSSVAVSGNTMLIGVTGRDNYRGAAYIFVWNGSGWVQQQKLTASDGAAGDYFGYSAALSGDTAFIGTLYGDAVYVFTRSGSQWSQQQILTASDGVLGDWFGWSVAVSGNTAVIGAPYKNNLLQGAAYIFSWNGSTWSEQQTLTAADPANIDYFGWSVAVSGDTAVIGAPGKNNRQGVAYLFTRTGGSWLQDQKLTADAAASDDEYGKSVAISGDRAVIGAPGRNTNRGAAYIVTRSDPDWLLEQTLLPADATTGEFFGCAARLFNDTVVVGAWRKDNIKGAAYVFRRSGSTWFQQQKLTASDGMTGDDFGDEVAIDQTFIVVGVPGDTIGANTSQGSAWVFPVP